MKKILSVALSTAMAFSMFASVAFADTTVSTQDKFDALKVKGIFSGYPDGTAGLANDMTRAEFAKVITKVIGLQEVTGKYSYSDVGYNNAKNWAAPYIEAVTEAGVMQGQDLTKKLFNQKANVTVQELAEVLVKALKLEIPTTTDNTATEWAKGSVQAAINAGLLSKDLNFQANATRSLLVEAAFAAEAALHPVVVPVTTATKVASVSASNLKEVVVTFDGTVDVESAEEESNYSLKSGKAITSASLSEDEKTVTLTLSGVLANNKVDYLTLSNIKAGTKVLSEKEFQFSTADNTLPEVSSVKSLGTKSVKIVFSEPVALPIQSSFELDGKTYFGKITQPSSRTVILTPYNASALAVGEHKLVVGNVYDFANFKSLTSTHDVTVVEDKVAPTISEATATLETVTVTFSEEVDTDTISASNVYWKSGSSKKTADSFTVVSDNKVKFYFGTTNALPTGALPIYVEGVKDYSGNKIADGTTVVVTPEIDQTRPEVKKAVADDSKTILVTFSKSLGDSAESRSNYTVLNADGDAISVKSATIGSNNVVTLELYTALSAGDNTLTIKNVKDSTRLQNTMLDYTGKVNLADVTAPTIDSKLFKSEAGGTLIIGFDKKMDASTLQDLANYHVQVGTTRKPLTSAIADITVFNDSNAVAIKFADDVTFGTGTKDVSKLYVLGLKDEAGNLLKEFTDNAGLNEIKLDKDLALTLGEYDTDYPTYAAALTDNSQIAVKLSAGVSAATTAAFTVTNTVTKAVYTVNNVEVDGTSTVKLNFKDTVFSTTYSDDLEVEVNFGKLTTLAGNVGGTGTATVLDKVAPEFVGDNVTVSGNELTAKFSEEIVLDKAANASLLAKDFEITRYYDGKKLVAGNDFTVAVGTESITITLNDARANATEYSVKFLGSKYLTDTSALKNQVATFEKDSNKAVAK